MTQNEAYGWAKEQYAQIGIDTDKVIQTLKSIPVSLHCWQGDDVGGFENEEAGSLSGGIQVTGNYPGKARTIAELRSDIEKTMTLIPGSYRLNLHANYADFSENKKVDRDSLEIKHFKSWLDWAEQNNLPLDFNSTLFSHPKASGLTLSSKDKGIRDFWIEHVKRCREIGAEFGKSQKSPCIHNIWISDGMKDLPADREVYRKNLEKSLDEILSVKISKDYIKDAVESKVFGIGSESYVVGSHEFYMGYAIKNQTLLTIDMGHFHPTENVSDKLSSALMFVPEILLHMSRGVRWDSDHVVLFNDDMKAMCEEMVRTNQLEKFHIGTDYFDGSINRIGAWSIGSRATQKSLLFALLEPNEQLRKYEDEGNYFARLALYEQTKIMPFGIVWQQYCEECNVPSDAQAIKDILDYEKKIVSERSC